MATDPWLQTDANGNAPIARAATPTAVYRFSPLSGGDPLEPLPSVVVQSITQQLGPDPGVARIRYRFGTTDTNAPQSMEQALGTQYTLPETIEPGDRIVVRAMTPTGVWTPIFDGFAVAFELSLGPNREIVSILCVGIARANWDSVIPGAIYRTASQIATQLGPGAVDNVATDAVAHFNPRGKGNCIPDAGWDNTQDDTYPVFCDPDNGTATDPNWPATWDLAKAARYLILTGNTSQQYTLNPKGTDLDSLLQSYEPKSGTSFDLTDSSTYTKKPIQAPDKPVTGKAWPDALNEMIADKGFAMTWLISAADDFGSPQTELVLMQPQGRNTKSLWLQAAGSLYNPNLTNLNQAHISRDLNETVHEWTVEGELEEYEVSIILAPAFASAAGDSVNAAALDKFNKSDASYQTTNHNTYRLWIADEEGASHYKNASTAAITGAALNLDAVFGAPNGKTPVYVKRRRKPKSHLITTAQGTTIGDNLRPQLSISTDYAGPYPYVWNPNDPAITNGGSWQPVHGGWQLLPDRIGIRVTADNPNAWNIGKADVGAFENGIVKAVESIGNPTAGNPAFFLRLTVVIQSDTRVIGQAENTLSNPYLPIRARTLDAHDRLKKQTVQSNSQFNTTTDDNVVRDDQDLALAEANALQLVTQFGLTQGPVVIPRFTAYYNLGDRIDSIQGRNLGFRVDDGNGDMAAFYPVVTARTWIFEPRQETHLTLSDASAARTSYAAHLRMGASRVRHR